MSQEDGVRRREVFIDFHLPELVLHVVNFVPQRSSKVLYARLQKGCFRVPCDIQTMKNLVQMKVENIFHTW